MLMQRNSCLAVPLKKYPKNFHVTQKYPVTMFFLIHFKPMFHFYNKGFLMFSGGIEMRHWLKMVKQSCRTLLKKPPSLAISREIGIFSSQQVRGTPTD